MKAVREGGSLVSKVHQVSARAFARILKDHGIDGLNPAQGRIVFELWKKDPLSQTELAARTRLDKSTLALMLDRLEERGQVERTRDPADSRKRLVRATEANRALHAEYELASREMTRLFYKGIPETEIDAFEATLRKVLANLEGI